VVVKRWICDREVTGSSLTHHDVEYGKLANTHVPPSLNIIYGRLVMLRRLKGNRR